MTEPAVAPAAEPAAPSNEPAVAAVPSAPAASSWTESLPEGVQAWQEVQTSKDADSFWDQMSNMRSAIGTSVRIPSAEAGDEDMQAFKDKIAKVPGVTFFDESDPSSLYDRLGRPAEPGGYEWTAVEGFQDDPEIEGQFRKLAHESGLSREQADKVHQWLADNITTEQNDSKASFDHDMSVLKGEWGAAFDQNTNIARSTVKMLDGKVPGFADYLNESGAGNATAFIKVMHQLGSIFGEQGVQDFQNANEIMSPHEARLQIGEIRNNPTHPFNNELDPGHEAAKQKVMGLYKLVSPR